MRIHEVANPDTKKVMGSDINLPTTRGSIQSKLFALLGRGEHLSELVPGHLRQNHQQSPTLYNVTDHKRRRGEARHQHDHSGGVNRELIRLC